MKGFLFSIALILLVFTALPILRFDQWWIRIFDFPRVQICLVGILVLSLYLFFWKTLRAWDLVMIGLLVLAVGYQLVRIFPYTILMPKQVVTAETQTDAANFKLLVANVLMENRRSDQFLAVVRSYDPDVIVSMETDDWWEQALRPLEKNYPHTLKHPLNNTYGMIVHSRMAMIDPEIRFILDDAIPSMHMKVAMPSQRRIQLHFLHPDPPNPRHATETTERDAELLIVAREVDQREKPTIIAGDFNDVAWSDTTRLFQKASGLLDPRIGRGMFNTYNARIPFLRWPLDHVFHSEHFKLVRLETGPGWGSDHFPVFIELNLRSDDVAEHEEPETNPSEKAEVTETIETARQDS